MSIDEAINNPSNGSKRAILAAALLAAVALAVFSPAIQYQFIHYDDNLYVYANPMVLGGLSGPGLRYSLTTHDAGTWGPATWLSLQIDTTLLGPRPSSYHVVNILLHVAAGVLLFAALQLMLKSIWTSLLVAGIFLLHPLRVESVAWIAERKDVLCAFFWCLGLVAYAAYVQKPSRVRGCLVLASFVGGLLAKMMIVTFPFVLLLLDFWPLKRFRAGAEGARAAIWPLIREKIPLFVLSALGVVVNARAQTALGTLHPIGENLFARLLSVPEHYCFYLGKIFWPVDLSILHPVQPPHVLTAALDSLLLLLLTGLALWEWRRRPWLIVGWLWFLGVLVPVIGFVSYGVYSVADRYAYLPSIGLTLALVVTMEEWTRRLLLVRWAVAVAVVTACVAVTSATLPDWRNSFSVFAAALRSGPHAATYNNRGTAYYELGYLPQALEDFSAAVRMQTNFAEAYSNRGCVLNELGRYDEAIVDCTRALEIDPSLADAYSNRGISYQRGGHAEEALSDYNRAIDLRPGVAVYFNNRAGAYFSLKRYDEAAADLKHCQHLGGEPTPGLVSAVEEATRLKEH